MQLGAEAGERFTCYFDADGLPEKLIFYPMSDSDAPADPLCKMQWIASGPGNNLEAYLKDQLGLTSGVDYQRHANGMRGGLRYFDMLSDHAIHAIQDRAAKAVGQSGAEDRASQTFKDVVASKGAADSSKRER